MLGNIWNCQLGPAKLLVRTLTGARGTGRARWDGGVQVRRSGLGVSIRAVRSNGDAPQPTRAELQYMVSYTRVRLRGGGKRVARDYYSLLNSRSLGRSPRLEFRIA